MEEALGTPETMAERSEELTPMLSQYSELCSQYERSLLLFQVGDFYEAFCEAAATVARLCEVTLTQREDSTGTYRMAGVPVEDAESYVRTLLQAGYRVAIADQVEDPEAASGVVERAVTRVVTPGTLTEDELLAGADNNYVASLVGEYALALLDVSTGDFLVTSTDSRAALRDEVGRFAPAEALVASDAPADVLPADCMVTPYSERFFALEPAGERVSAYLGDPETVLGGPAEVRACGALLAYAEYARGGADDDRLSYITHVTRYDPPDYLLLDAVAIDSLELFDRRAVGADADATLIDVIDETGTAPGRRRLTDWLRRPLVDRDRIAARHDAVEALLGDVVAREAVAGHLRDVYDLERLVSRAARGRATARDLRSLADTLAVVPEIDEALAGVDGDALAGIRADLEHCTDVREAVDAAIREDPPIEVTEGDVIREGYSDELDDLRATEREGKAWIDELEARERERTGVDSLSVGYTAVHGYYIEVTDPNLDRVPEEYTRRQTLKNAERFATPALTEREEEIVRAEKRADDLEYELFTEVRATVADAAGRLQNLADALARLDALVSLATVAATGDYVRPTLGADGVSVTDGRHPVVEGTVEEFVPNDTDLPADTAVALVTGPNMSGKSTYMRQVALICILAQMGSFVPAAAARLPVLDRVFTRIGASDDLAGGRSTFMVEMTELADILEGATADSLVLLDEVGRGTATTDGLAIARAVTEYLHDDVGATALFATHHHELTRLADRLEGVVNRHFAATEVDDGVVFDHELAPGAATASYGVEVAGSAGVPDAVVERARELLEEPPERDGRRPPEAGRRRGQADPAPAADGGASDPIGLPSGAGAVVADLEDVTLADTTPMEALRLLDRLTDHLE